MNDSSDVMYRLLVQSVVDYAIYMLKPDGTIVNWNTGAQRAKGYLPEEIIGKNFSCFYSEQEQQEGLPQYGLSIARKTGRYENQGWRYRKDGSTFWAHVAIDAIRNDQGELLGFAKVTRDCTELHDYEQSLREARELAEVYSEKMASLSIFHDTIVSHIPSSVIIEDVMTRKILLMNNRAQRLLGGEKNDFIGKSLSESMPSSIGEYFAQLSDVAQRKEGTHRNKCLLNSTEGDRVIDTSASVIRGTDTSHNYVLLMTDDITEQHAADSRIRHMAYHDNLTNLPNRVLFSQRLNEALEIALQTRTICAVLCLDLDHFKHVNDTLGHHVGDMLLRAVAVRLRSTLREQDTLARTGGDEFSVVLPNLNQREEADSVASRLIEIIRAPFDVEGYMLSVGLSVGIVIVEPGNCEQSRLLRCADMALYEAKRNGRNRFEYFTETLEEEAEKRHLIENDLREAIHSGQFKLYYQPITNCQNTEIIGYEALMRWHHPERGLIMPDDFIPVAEETGLIHTLGAYALHEACREAASWPTTQSVAVNLSPLQFKSNTLLSVIEAALRKSGLAPERLEVEITESVLLDNSSDNIDVLKRLKALGVQIALDDFGTGYSSLSYMRSFPFDKIKIDKSFISDMHYSRESLAIIRAITGMSSSLDIKITAEGVENIEQFEQLKKEGCTLFQGYYFGYPQPPDRRLEML
ncbi:EAL domain-containing protein [Klebsiella sp. BIGb0407]|uniref:sensor domain-containing protein n=1 Tax=Klebsiella sp. BIGb0407 TaxID=2940603 RepID=UPI0021685A61|nr:EAL domain-containing protein [Klebsiella sp. BIGb0407]MCS3430145.1 diguanylate cyclase (GGDEF)-like protein/PAS domain S-box-containing protein [Klebsiella sp. BIGb0407]